MNFNEKSKIIELLEKKIEKSLRFSTRQRAGGTTSKEPTCQLRG